MDKKRGSEGLRVGLWLGLAGVSGLNILLNVYFVICDKL